YNRSIPIKTTTTQVVIQNNTVKVALPPIESDKFTAIGMVTMRGSKLSTYSSLKANQVAVAAPTVTAMKDPAAILVKITRQFVLIKAQFRYRGTAKATVTMSSM